MWSVLALTVNGCGDRSDPASIEPGSRSIVATEGSLLLDRTEIAAFELPTEALSIPGGAVLWPTGERAPDVTVLLKVPREDHWIVWDITDVTGRFDAVSAPPDAVLLAVWGRGLHAARRSRIQLEAGHGLCWSSDEVSVEDAIHAPIVLHYVSGSEEDAYVLGGTVETHDGAPLRPGLRIQLLHRKYQKASAITYMLTNTKEFVIPHSGFVDQKFVPLVRNDDSWHFRIDSHSGIHQDLEVPRSPGLSVELDLRLQLDHQEFFEGVIRDAQLLGRPLAGARVYYEDRAPNEDRVVFSFTVGGDLDVWCDTDNEGKFRIYMREGRVPSSVYVEHFKRGIHYELSQEEVARIEPEAMLEIFVE